MRSFRLQLAWRYSGTMFLGALLVAALGYLALRATLDRQIDASLVAVASIQAAAVTDDPSGDMRFYEWDLTASEVTSLSDLNRYAQIWDDRGVSQNRSRLLASDLPLDEAALQSAAGGEIAWAEGRYGNEPVRSVFYPLARLGEDHVDHARSHAGHILQVAAPLGWRNRTLQAAGLFLGWIVLLATASAFAGSWWLAGRAVRAVGEITAQAEDIGAETLGRRITAHAGTREFERLVRVLNTMLDRLDAAFDAQRRFTADASHELRSPLTALRGELELARRRDRSPEEYRRVIDSSLEEATRLTRLTEDLLTLARSDAGAMRPQATTFDLSERVRAAADRLRPRAAERGVELGVGGPGDVMVEADPEMVDRLVWNLLDNALKYTGSGGRVDVRVESDGEHAVVEVADTGPGLGEDLLPVVFERFSRGDPAHAVSDSTGLGLSIVRAIAQAHGGAVDAENRPEGGARFTVQLPLRYTAPIRD